MVERELEPGVAHRCVGRFKELGGGGHSFSKYAKGSLGSFRVIKVLGSEELPLAAPLLRLRSKMIDAINPSASDARALLAGVVLGRTTELAGSDADECFSRTGLSHLIAVSGSHLACIAGYLGLLMRGRGPTDRIRSILLLSLVIAYVAFTGLAASAIRSAIMIACSTCAAHMHRRPHALSGLMVAVAMMCAIDPGVVFDLGFQLSAISVLFISLFSGYVSRCLQVCGAPRAIADAGAMGACAQWGTMPITVPIFNSVSLVSLPANLLVGPLMTLLMSLGVVLVPVSTLFPRTEFLVIPLEWMGRACIFLAQLFDSIPFASMLASAEPALAVLAYAAAILLYLLWPRPRAWGVIGAVASISAVFAFHVARWMIFAPCAMTVLDVGQGDAILLRDGSCSVLVDAGVDSKTRSALARNNVYRLDALVITHWDTDHWGGLESFYSEIPIDRIIVARGARSHMPDAARELISCDVVEVANGDELHIGEIRCRVVSPTSDVTGEENADSLCLDVEVGARQRPLRALLTGDAERAQLSDIALAVGDIDVLKLGHHGSAQSVDARLLSILDPEVAIASAGRGNSYGHPSRECLDAVDAHGSTFLCTMDEGDVVFAPTEEGFSVFAANGRG